MALSHFALKHHGGKRSGATGAQQAAYIMRDVKTPETKAYVEYVLRQSRKTADREDLAWVHMDNMPMFAKGKPVSFFLAADENEGVNRRVSSSLEIALPRQLSRDRQKELIEDFCASQFPHQPFVAGLHDSIGASGEPNPHFHVTWSERIHDGVERTSEDFFRRPPYGAGKDPIYHERGWLKAARQSWSDLVNVALEREGITDAYVDLRSLQDRGIERKPEPRLSPLDSTRAKRDNVITDQWQRVLDGRKDRERDRGHEQTLAREAWEARKAELLITDIQVLNRPAFVAQIRWRTMEMVRNPRPRPTLEELQAETERLHAKIARLEQYATDVDQARQGHPFPPSKLVALLAGRELEEGTGKGLTMKLYDKERDDGYGR